MEEKEKKFRLFAGLSGIIFSILLCGIYVYFRKLPFFDVELDASRRRYFLMIYIMSVVGVFLYLAAKEKIDAKRLKLVLHILSYTFIFGFHVILFLTNGTSSLGWEWAFSTFLIGLFPALSIAYGLLILFGYRRFSIWLLVLFGISAIFYIIMFVVELGIFGAAPVSNPLLHIIFAIVILAFSIAAIPYNWKNFRLPIHHAEEHHT